MPRGALEIIEFDPSRMMPAAGSCVPPPSDTDTRLDVLSHLRLQYRAATSLIAALAVLALHALVLLPQLWGGSSATDSRRFGTPSAIHALLIDDRPANAIAYPVLSAPSLSPVSVNLPETLNRKDTDPGLAALYGRYLGQVHARIERAWLKPRTAIGADLFRCQVEIWQGRDGTVQTVTLQRCNGSIRWQHSLEKGIEEASPLPAPPDSAVFAHRVVLHFEAVAFAQGQSADNYEPARSALRADSDGSVALSQIHSLHQPTMGPHALSAIELRITGSHVQVEPITKASQEHP